MHYQRRVKGKSGVFFDGPGEIERCQPSGHEHNSQCAGQLVRPLAGHEAVLPVSDDVMHWHASPRAAVGFLLHAATIDGDKLGARRALSMPGLAVTVGQQIEALRKVAGEKVVARIRREPDPFVIKIVEGWPRNFETKRSIALGFQADKSFEDIIRIHIDDELGGKIA